MEWKDLKGLIGKAAPVLGTLLGGPAGAAAGALVSSALGVDNEPEEVHKALQANPDLLLKLRQTELMQQAELQKMMVESETAKLTQVNETMRAELASGDKFKSYWRPLFGYIMALTWGAVMLAVTWQIIFKPADVGSIMKSLSELTGLWGIGLAVLGVNVYKRSSDKAAMYGNKGESALSLLKGITK